MIKQIAIIAENKRGQMNNITSVLAKAGINLIALVTNDSAEFGIVRLLASDPELAKTVLEEAGYMVRLDKVIAVPISDDAGSLDKLLSVITESYINVNYIYISYDREAKGVIVVLKADGAGEVEMCLQAKGYHPLSD